MPAAMSNSPTPFVGVRIPAPLRKAVRRRVKGGGYRTISEYIRDLIRRDIARRAKQ